MKSVYSYLAIILITFLVYYNSLSNEFVFDDESVIQNNQSITSTDNIPKFFTAEDGFHKVIGRYYRPIVSSSYAIDFSIWGLNPYGFHLTNIIIHILSCLLLYKILSMLFWRYKYRNLFALFSTLIFAVHPVHTEAVSWISGRTDSMVTMFFFASFLFYIEYTKELKFESKEHSLQTVKGNRTIYLLLSLFFYSLGLLTKEMIVTMPLIILAYDFIYRKKDFDYIKKHIPVYALFAGITLIYLLLRYYLLMDIPERESYLYFFGKDFTVTIGTMIKTIPVYFRLLFAPFQLLYHYNGVIADAKTLIDSEVLLSAAFIILLIYLSYFFYKKDSIVSFCIAFFLITLLPVMNFIPSMNLMAERFLYMVSFCLVLLICHVSLLGSAKRDFTILIFGLTIIVISLSYLTYVRNEQWKDNNTLYMTGNNVKGTVLLVNSGNILANQKKYDEASKLYKKAIEIRDNNLLAHHNLGLVYLIRGSLDSAEVKFKKGISIDSLAPDGYFQLATIYNMQEKKEDAILMLEKLQNIVPDYKGSSALLQTLKSGESTGTSMLPGAFGNDEALNTKLATLQKRSFKLYSEKKYEDAVNDLKELIRLSPDASSKSGFLNNIAMCYSELKNPQMEEKYFLESISTDPKNINALNGLSAYYLKANNREKALEYIRKILLLNPSDENAKRKLDSLNKEK